MLLRYDSLHKKPAPASCQKMYGNVEKSYIFYLEIFVLKYFH